MNINEIQKQNTENLKLNSLTHHSAQKSDNNFSYYVEISKTQDIKNQMQENQENENNNQEQEELLLQVEQPEETNNLTYTQSVENLKAGLFDLGITDENGLSNKKDIYNIKFNELTLDDIKLFDGLSQKSTDLVLNSVEPQKGTFNITINNEGMNVSYRSLEVSKTLFSAIENAAKTGKPIRLDFGQDTSVILKISKDGKLSADFIPNEKAMEVILRNALPELKAKFDEENLPYNELTYRNFNQQQKQNQKENNKEKKDE